MKSRLLGILSLLVLVLALTACDGSSGSSSSSSGASGAVAAAPLEGAKVLSLLGDEEILIGTTDKNGAFVGNGNAAKLTFPAVVFSRGGWNVNDSAHTPETEFAGKLEGVLESATGKVFLTPTNTLVAALFKKTGDLYNARSIVTDLVKNEIGIDNVDPLGNPLGANLTKTEMVSTTLMYLLGAKDESAAAMDTFAKNIDKISVSLTTGNSFTKEVQNLEGSPANGSTGALCNFVKTDLDIIKKMVKTTLDIPVEETIEGIDDIEVVDTSAFPRSIDFKETEGNTFSKTVVVDSTADIVVTFKPIVELNDGTKPSTNLIATFTNGELAGVDLGDEVASDTTLTFTINHEEIGSLPFSSTVTLKTTGDHSIERTFTINLIEEGSFAVEKVTSKIDQKFWKFGDTKPANFMIEKGTDVVPSNAFLAQVELFTATLNDDEVSSNMDVRFSAPEGFVFGDNTENTDKVLIKNFKDIAGATFDVAVDAKFNKITAAKDVTPGFKAITIDVLDEAGNTLKTTTEEVVFVPYGHEDALQAFELALKPTALPEEKGAVDENTVTINPTAAVDEGETKLFTSSITFDGNVKTWAQAAGTTSDKVDFDDNSIVYLVSTSGNSPFEKDGKKLDKLPISVMDISIDSEFNFKSTVESFAYRFANADENINDDIKLVFIPNKENPNDNIESSKLFKLILNKKK